jgi:GrpB-like predicted nucleotidyltransferase (UPF0157 family)
MSAIKVVDYDPTWPALFEQHRRRLSDLLAGVVEEIHHVGSTAVVGLSAKPKIDIDAVVRSHSMLADAVERVRSVADYTFHGDPYGDGMWTFTTGHGSHGSRLYLCGPDNTTHRKRMIFRDWLRAHPDDAADYAALKLQLASAANGDWKVYTGGKAEFVAGIVALASAAEQA